VDAYDVTTKPGSRGRGKPLRRGALDATPDAVAAIDRAARTATHVPARLIER
jgi:hypothetical protein